MAGDALLGREMGRYRIESIIGSGGFATVYRAIDLALERPVALKVVDPTAHRNPTIGRRFVLEGRAVASLDHPAIVPVYDAGESDGVLWMAMRLIAGGSLDDALVAGRRFTFEQVAAVAARIGDALDHAHGHGIVHRDVKPSNILLEQNDPARAWLADFGIAATTRTAGRYTTGALGTAAYMAPEQARPSTVGPPADLYSLGCVTYELLTRRRPFPGDDYVELLVAHATHPVPPTVWPRVDAFLQRALAKDPTARPPSGKAFAEELRRSLIETQRTRPAPPPAAERDKATAAAPPPAPSATPPRAAAAAAPPPGASSASNGPAGPPPTSPPAAAAASPSPPAPGAARASNGPGNPPAASPAAAAAATGPPTAPPASGPAPSAPPASAGPASPQPASPAGAAVATGPPAAAPASGAGPASGGPGNPPPTSAAAAAAAARRPAGDEGAAAQAQPPPPPPAPSGAASGTPADAPLVAGDAGAGQQPGRPPMPPPHRPGDPVGPTARATVPERGGTTPGPPQKPPGADDARPAVAKAEEPVPDATQPVAAAARPNPAPASAQATVPPTGKAPGAETRPAPPRRDEPPTVVEHVNKTLEHPHLRPPPPTGPPPGPTATGHRPPPPSSPPGGLRPPPPAPPAPRDPTVVRSGRRRARRRLIAGGALLAIGVVAVVVALLEQQRNGGGTRTVDDPAGISYEVPGDWDLAASQDPLVVFESSGERTATITHGPTDGNRSAADQLDDADVCEGQPTDGPTIERADQVAECTNASTDQPQRAIGAIANGNFWVITVERAADETDGNDFVGSIEFTTPR